jgi:hypothetical protein
MDNTFLILSLFLPRITLIIYYWMHSIPYNNVPFVGDILLSVFLPRVLILIYIADNLGTSNYWFWIHLVVALLVYIFSGNKANKKWGKKN